jgi:hypothetical protein
VERSNHPFKEALLAWMMDNNDRDWARYGMHVVNAQMNRRPSRVKANFSPNQIFYGKKHDKHSVYNVLGTRIVKLAETEAGLEAAYMAVCNSKDPICDHNVEQIIRDADAKFLQELIDDGVLPEGKEDDVVEEDDVGKDDRAEEREEGADNHNPLKDNTTTSKESGKSPLKESPSNKNSTSSKESGPSPLKESPTSSKESCKSPSNKSTTSSKESGTPTKENAASDGYGDTPGRGAIRSQVFLSTKAQAKQVNSRRKKFFKEVLEIGDICNVHLEGKIHGAEGPKYLPVAVMEVTTSQKGATTYRVASKHGFLIRKYQRQELHFMPLLTKELLGINESYVDFRQTPMTEQIALSLYSVVGVTGKCKCTGDCASSGSKCSCKSKGIFCTSKCHGGRGSKGAKKCMLRPPVSPPICLPCVEEK